MNATNMGGNVLQLCTEITDEDALGDKVWDIYDGAPCFQLGKNDNSAINPETLLPNGFTAYVPNSYWGHGRGPIKTNEELSEGTPLDDDDLTWPWSDNE